MTPRLAGTYAATVTPFTRGGAEVDVGAIAPHLAFLAERGGEGIVPIGTTGEFASMSVDERRAVLDEVAAVRGNLRAIACVGSCALPDAIALGRHAVRKGFEALLLPPPFYDHAPRTAGVVGFFRAFLEAVEAPTVLYHIPARTGVPLTPEIVEPLLAYPHLAGIKDTGGEVGTTARFVRDFGDRLEILIGSDALVAEAHRAGAVGTISAMANIVPEAVAAVSKALREGGDADGAQARLNRIRAALKARPMPAALKAALALLAGLPRTAVRPPAVDLEPDEVRALEADLLALDIIGKRSA